MSALLGAFARDTHALHDIPDTELRQVSPRGACLPQHPRVRGVTPAPAALDVGGWARVRPRN
jgi:hypothetical protein